MNKNLTIGDLCGICTITRKGAYSQLIVGDPAVQRPFSAFEGMDLQEMQRTMKVVKVSDKKLKGVVLRQKQSNQKNIILQNILLKRIEESIFFNQPSESSIKEVTGLKPIKWVKGKAIFQPLTTMQLLLCTMADFAYMQFGTTWGVSVQVSLNNGEVIRHKF